MEHLIYRASVCDPFSTPVKLCRSNDDTPVERLTATDMPLDFFGEVIVIVCKLTVQRLCPSISIWPDVFVTRKEYSLQYKQTLSRLRTILLHSPQHTENVKWLVLRPKYLQCGSIRTNSAQGDRPYQGWIDLVIHLCEKFFTKKVDMNLHKATQVRLSCFNLQMHQLIFLTLDVNDVVKLTAMIGQNGQNYIFCPLSYLLSQRRLKIY